MVFLNVLLISKDTKEFKLMNLYDQFGNICGKDEAEGFDYLYINPSLNPKNAFKKRFCVQECPSETGDRLKCMKGNKYKECTKIVISETIELLDRLCIETPEGSFYIFKFEKNFSYIKECIFEIVLLRKYYVYFFAVCLIMTLVMFFCFRFLSGMFVYLLIIVAIASLVLGGLFCLEKSRRVHEFDSDENERDF